MVILEFPTAENAKAFLADPDAQALFALRHRTTVSKLVLVEGVSELPLEQRDGRRRYPGRVPPRW